VARVSLSVLFLLLSAGVWATGPFSSVKILTEDSPPGEVRDVTGRVTGPVAELVRELGRRMGVQQEMEMLPWTRAYSSALSEPRIAIFETTRTPERENLFRWVGPINQIKWQFWAKKSSSFRPKTLEDVRKLGAVAVYLSDSKTDYLELKGFTDLSKVATSEQAVKMLNSGRVSTWMASDRGPKELITALGLSIDDYEPVYTLETKYLYVALSLDFTVAETKLWQETLDQMKREGVLTKLYRDLYPPTALRDLSRPGDPYVPGP